MDGQAGLAVAAAEEVGRYLTDRRRHRDAIIDRAVSEGRISAATRDTWRAQLDEAEEGTVALIGSLAANTIPVAEIGFSDGVTSDDDRTYAHAFGTKENS